MTDDEKERIAIELEHLEPAEAQKEFDERTNPAPAISDAGSK